MTIKKSDLKVPRRSFLIQLRNLSLISSLQIFSNKVAAISAPRMRKAKRALVGPVATLWSWGDGTNGKLGNTNSHRSSPVQVGSLTDWTAISAGDEHSVALKSGTLWAFGRNNAGQLGDGTAGNLKSSPVQVGSGVDWQKIAGGGSFTLASKTNNTLWAFGNNGSGRLGIGNTTNYSSPTQIGALTDWNSFEAGGAFGVAVKTNGTLWTWGANDVGQLGDGSNINKSSPTQIGSATNWKKVITGFDHTVALKLDGTLWTWGSNEQCQQGFIVSSPQLVNSVNTWSMIAARKQSTVAGDTETAGGCAIRTDGTLWCWGSNIDGQVGAGLTQSICESPRQIGSATDWAFVAVGPWSTAAVKTTGTLWAWGYNNSGELGLGHRNSVSTPVQVGLLSDWSKVSIGESFMLAVKTDFSLWSWGGSSSSGVLGSGTSTAKRSSPVQVGSLSDWSQVVCGPRSSCAIKTDGTLWTWGAGTQNQLGVGSLVTLSSPVQIGTDTTWTMVSKGIAYGMGIKGGTLWGWGDNATGQLGLGNKTSRSTPVQVGTETNWTYIACAYSDTLGIKGDGSIWNWGTSTDEFNFSGTSSPSQRLTSVRIGAETTWSKVDLGEQGVLALQTDSKLWAWGRPFGGALGIVVISPKQLGSGTTWSDIAAGNYHTVATQTDGTLWNWGSNSDGQMGTSGSYAADGLPVKLGAGTTWTKVSAGGYTSGALKSDGTAWTWGYDNRGQLGDGAVASRSSPTQIGSSTNWSAISVGDYHMISIRT
jgi:alpha-tubulin suppressor-like RCC1 family protein